MKILWCNGRYCDICTIDVHFYLFHSPLTLFCLVTSLSKDVQGICCVYSALFEVNVSFHLCLCLLHIQSSSFSIKTFIFGLKCFCLSLKMNQLPTTKIIQQSDKNLSLDLIEFYLFAPDTKVIEDIRAVVTWPVLDLKNLPKPLVLAFPWGTKH